MPRPPPTASPSRSGGRCSSPTSCATWRRMPRAGRLYLPREYLDAAGVPHDPARALASPGLDRACRRLAALAHEPFPRRARGDGGMRPPRDEAGAADGRDLCGAARPAGAPGLGASGGAGQPAGLAEALDRDALRRRHEAGARRGRRARGSCRGARARRCRMAGHAVRGRAGGGRPLPLLFRPRARLPHRQRQPPAALRQPRGLRLSRAGSAPPARWAARRRHAFRSSTSRAASAGRCGPMSAASRGGSLVPSRRVPGTRLGRVPRAAARLLRAGARRDGRIADAAAACSDRAWSSRSPWPRSTPGRGRGAPSCWPRCCARRCSAAVRSCLPRFPRAGPFGELRRSGARGPGRAWGGDPPRLPDRFPRSSTASVWRRLATPDGPVALGPDECVVLAVPPPVAAALLPGLTVPDAFEAILNLHYRVAADPGEAGFVGLVGGTAEWVFVKPGIVSVTISAANHLVDMPADALAARVWPEAARALGLAGPAAALPRGEGEARHLRRHAGAGGAPARRPAPASAISSSPATGPTPACPQPSKVPSGPAGMLPRCCNRSEPEPQCRARR